MMNKPKFKKSDIAYFSIPEKTIYACDEESYEYYHEYRHFQQFSDKTIEKANNILCVNFELGCVLILIQSLYLFFSFYMFLMSFLFTFLFFIFPFIIFTAVIEIDAYIYGVIQSWKST